MAKGGTASGVDVVMLTKNSMRPSLPETIASVYANIPVNRLIVVDGGSKDGTVEFLSGQKGAVLVDDSKGTRATARQKGIEAVETELFAFVDSDVVLQPRWYDLAMAWFANGVGGVSTFSRQLGDEADTQRAVAKLYRLRSVSDLARRKRFDTAASLIRTEAVRGLKIPRELQAGEDEFIGRFIQGRGFRAFGVPSPVVCHRRTEPQTDSPITRGRLLRRHGWRTTRYMARQMLLSVPEGVFICLYTGNCRAGVQRFRYSTLAFVGYVTGPSSYE
ncbi:MAG: glycosyltransferase family 2 protein [Nitrososphaerota archaeon]|nr:glycosyltransferase family 2 protein [Nitrososphaerota archaeon]MDG7023445.1 glycosyltransferase family 2 protein [Nitrososphaerota archaeon]